MKLSEVLELSGFNRNTYNALKREKRVAFMADDSDPDADEGNMRDRFGIGHALALRCVRGLMMQGATAAQAAMAVSETFDYVMHKIDALIGQPSRYEIKDYLYVTNYGGGSYGWTLGDAPTKHFCAGADGDTDESSQASSGSIMFINIAAMFADVRSVALKRAGLEG